MQTTVPSAQHSSSTGEVSSLVDDDLKSHQSEERHGAQECAASDRSHIRDLRQTATAPRFVSLHIKNALSQIVPLRYEDPLFDVRPREQKLKKYQLVSSPQDLIYPQCLVS